MKITTLILLGLLYWSQICSQEYTWEQKTQLSNSTILTKYYMNSYPYMDYYECDSIILESRPRQDWGVDCSCDMKTCPRIYYENNEIRMIELSCGDAGSYYMQRCYFDKKGKLSHFLLRDSDHSEGEIKGYMYLLDNDSIYYNFTTSYDFQTKLTHTGYSSTYLKSIEDFELRYYENVSEIIKRVKGIRTEGVQVILDKPSVGDLMYTNALNINVRKCPSLTSEIISQLNLGDNLIVKETVMQEGEINSKGWFKVQEYGTFRELGYIYGDFLEPVEKEVK